MDITNQLYSNDDGVSITATLTDSNGSAVDLTGSTVSFTMYPVGIGSTPLEAPASIVEPLTGEVRYDFEPEDIDTPGDYEYVFTVTTADGNITYPSAPSRLRILHSPSEVTTTDDLIVTHDEVFTFTSQHVDDADILKAQNLISLILDLDLADLSTLDDRDVRRIKQATAYQAADGHGKTAAQATSMNLPPGVTSVSQGDITLTFGGSATASEVVSYLSPLAAKILSRLSWVGGKTIRPVQDYDVDDHSHPWSRVVDLNAYAYYPPISRGAPPDVFTLSTSTQVVGI